jgi:UDP-N-acetylglucosamine 4-epimerase
VVAQKDGPIMIFPELKGKQYHFLVTGGAGFIGSNLVLELLRSGQRVTVLDNLSTGRRQNIADIEDFVAANKIPSRDFIFVEGDIRDKEVCLRATEGADYVLHNAALGSVPRSIDDPVTTTEVNVMGSVNMLVASRDAKAKRFVYASSSSVYGDSTRLPRVEGDEGRPISPYAITKVVGELYAENFQHLYGLEVIGLRYFNVFGPRQDPYSQYAAIIPIFVRKLLGNQAPTIFGDGETTRDFTYVDNAVQANIRAVFAGKEATGRVYNIACGSRFSLNELYKKLSVIVGKDIKPLYGPERKGDIRHSDADITRAKRFLKYEPEIDAVKGLELVIQWYTKHL